MSSSPGPEDYELAVADTVEATAEIYETIDLHPNGNAVLVVRGSSKSIGKRFTVSSDTLGLASLYFRTMFNSSFKEGIETRSGLCPDIPLEDDDPEAMEILLSLLHFNIQDKYINLDPMTITMVAQKSDKYECNKAMTPWALKWLSNVAGDLRPEIYGFLLAAAYLFDIPEVFQSLSAIATKHMSPRSMEKWPPQHLIMATLPEVYQNAVAVEINALNEWISTEVVEKVETSLQQDRHAYGRPDFERYCIACDTSVSPSTTKHCFGQDNVRTTFCSNETRVAVYFRILRKHSVYCSVGSFKACSGMDLVRSLQAAREDKSYMCSAKDCCPLADQIYCLAERVAEFVDDVKGVTIPSRAMQTDERRLATLSFPK